MRLKVISILLSSTTLLLTSCGSSGGGGGESGHTHVWGDPIYTWASDNSSCTATRVCTLDSTHVESETSSSSFVIVTRPTESTEGLKEYSADFTNPAFTSKSKEASIPSTGSIDTYEKAVNCVLTDHNYSAHLNNQWANEEEAYLDFNYYNIDDNVMFDDYEAYFYSGYIKQKGQGIVSFQLNKSASDTSGLILGNFKATNLERSISDIYTIAVEYIAKEEFVYDSSLELYKSSSMKAMAVLANLGFGDYTSMISAPEYITAKFENGVITYKGTFDINYFDVIEIHTTADVTLTVSNLNRTTNPILEGYIKNPDYTFVAPTSWDSDTLKLFKEQFNNFIPPFINGMSYAWKAGQSVSEGFYVAMVEDYLGGDLTTSYRDLLVKSGFHEVSNPGLIEYQKVVEEETLIHTYSVKMRYYAPDETDSSGMKYSYLYPNGVSSFKFLHKQKTKDTITTVALLNEYIGNSIVGDYLPKFALADDTKVVNFTDASSSEGTYVIHYRGRQGTADGEFFRIYADSKESATAAVEKYVADLRLLGMSGSSSAMMGQYWMSDDHSSMVQITDPKYISNWTDKSYLQVRIEICQATIDDWKEMSITLDSISVSGQTTSWTVGDTFAFDGVVTAKYSSGYEEVVEPTYISTPDMSQSGQQVVLVKYKNAKGEEASCDYVIDVNPAETKYSISIKQVSGATITLIYPVSGESPAGNSVTFEAVPDSGYQVDSVSATCNGQSIDIIGPIPSQSGNYGYAFIMKTGDVLITASVSKIVEKHNISYVVKDVDTLETLDYNTVIALSSSLPKSAEEGSLVNFQVVANQGYSVNFLQVGTAVLPNPPFSLIMGSEDIIVEIYVKVDQGGGGGEEADFGGTYQCVIGNYAGKYTVFTLTFNEDGTGAYQRLGDGKVDATMQFTYVIKDNKITFTYVSGNNTDFPGGKYFWLFTDTTTAGVNSTGVFSSTDNAVTVNMYNNRAASEVKTFSKA